MMIVAVVVIAIVAPGVLGVRAAQQNLARTYQQPSWEYWLGTDGLGRDILARLLVATRLSLLLGLAAAGIGIGIGAGLGGIAPLLGRRARLVLLRAIDVLLSFPGLLIAILVSAILGVGARSAVLGVGIGVSAVIARMASTLAMSVAGRDYVSAARIIGVSRTRLLLRYVLPNIAEPLLLAAAVAVSSSIVIISALSFLGLGVADPQIDWGRLLSVGLEAIYVTPAAAFGPAAAIALTAMAFGFLGEGLARAMNPRLWTSQPHQRPKRITWSAGRPSAFGRGMDRSTTDYLSLHAFSTPNRSSGVRTVLEVDNLELEFPGPDGPIKVLDGVSFSIDEGEIVGVVGESGSGKTMTALAVSRLAPYPGTISGKVVLQGSEVGPASGRRSADRILERGLAMIFQDPIGSFNPTLRVGTQMGLPLRVHGGASKREAKRVMIDALRDVAIADPERQIRRYPHEFSGGMLQRAMIAKALMKNAPLLIADEPTTALDVTIQAQIVSLLSELNTKQKTAILLISHNIALVSQTCSRILVMYAGRIVEELPTDDLVQGRALHPYTQALVQAVPKIDHPRDVPLMAIAGDVPDIKDLPAGCPFHPRCPLALDICRVEMPLLLDRQTGNQRVACHVANAQPRSESQ